MSEGAIERLLTLADYWDEHRQVGHTTAMLRGVIGEPGTIVIVHNQHAADGVKHLRASSLGGAHAATAPYLASKWRDLKGCTTHWS